MAETRLREVVDELVREALSNLPALYWKPGEGVWTSMDVLCHVEEFIPYWAGEVRRVIADSNYTWGRTHADADRLAAVTNTSARLLPDVIANIRRAAAAVEGWSDAELAREATSRNPRWGLKPARFIVDHLLIEHVAKHIEQLRRNAAQYKEKHLSEFIFAPAATVSLPIAGQSARFPINRIFCVGRNYEAHAKEMGTVADREAPFYFTKAAVHAVESGATVPYPPGTSNYHYEMELVVAIGKGGFRISEESALEHVFGYACGLDMTRRDLQNAAKEKQRPWDLGKDVEQSAVAGSISPASVIGHPSSGLIELRVNGVTKQSSDISTMVHGVAAIIAHLSRYYHLQAGDLIYTGTPERVGAVKAGDKLEGSVAGVGVVELVLGEAE